MNCLHLCAVVTNNLAKNVKNNRGFLGLMKLIKENNRDRCVEWNDIKKKRAKISIGLAYFMTAISKRFTFNVGCAFNARE